MNFYSEAEKVPGIIYPNEKTYMKESYCGIPSITLAITHEYYKRKFIPEIVDPSLAGYDNLYEIIAVFPQYHETINSYCITDIHNPDCDLPEAILHYEMVTRDSIRYKYYGVRKLNLEREHPLYDHYKKFFYDPYKGMGYGWGRPKKFKKWEPSHRTIIRLPLYYFGADSTKGCTLSGEKLDRKRQQILLDAKERNHKEIVAAKTLSKRFQYLSRRGLGRVLEDMDLPTLPSRQLKPSTAYNRKKVTFSTENQMEEIVAIYADLGYHLTPLDSCQTTSFWRYILRIEDKLRDYSVLTKTVDTLQMRLQKRDINLVLVPEITGVEIQVPTVELPPLYLYDHINLLREQSDMYLPVFVGDSGDIRYEGGEILHSDKCKILDLAKAPHLLVAGSTGTGKSVFLHTLLHSLHAATQYIDPTNFCICDLKGNGFQEYLKTDPLRGYNGVDSYIELLTDHDKVVHMLELYVKCMQDRFYNMARVNEHTPHGQTVKNWYDFNALWAAKDKYVCNVLGEKTTRDHGPLVIIIDEWADLLYGAKNAGQRKHVIELLKRLTQKGREAAIHVVLATQSPRTDVLSGEIKNNFPCRICFRVPSSTDSRVALDRSGAEKLRSPGDAWFIGSTQDVMTRVVTPLPC